MLVSNITWIIVEDSSAPSNIVSKILAGCPVSSVHLHVKTTTFVSRKKGGGGHRGVEQRNEGLKWIRGNCRKMGVTKGVVYFGDDDNGYDYRLFEEMRYTKIISVWPVAFVGMLNYEGPKCKNGKVVDFHTVFRSDRRFPFDMAAFAVNLDVIMAHPKVYINHKSPAGMLENDFLTSLGLSRSMLEPKANDCKEIYVWHIKTEKPRMVYGKTHKGDPDIEANI
jgi:galactosylgalactosylxylosylprotein 3-beta-glucuronosyltransferase 3